VTRRRRRLALVVYAVAILSVAISARPAAAAKWNVAKLVRHADGNPFRCKVADDWGPKQNRCIVRVVWLDRPSIGREAEAIIACESGWDERQVTPPYRATGLAQFLPGTWRSYRWRHKSPKHPVFNVLQMRVVRMIDGDWHQWVCRP
jgi:hypothetical protein